MSSTPGSPLDVSTDTLGDEQITPIKSNDKLSSKDPIGVVSKLVNDFLATRGNLVPSARADVVFEDLSVEGSGRGVYDLAK